MMRLNSSIRPGLAATLLLCALAAISNDPAHAQRTAPVTTQQPAAAEAPVNLLALPPGEVIAIRACLPFNVLILPVNESTGNGSVTLTAERSVASAVSAELSGGTLVLSTAGDLRTRRLINLTVSLPDSASLRYIQNFGVGDLVVGAGLNPANLTVSATGTGGVFAVGVTTPMLRVLNAGVSTVSVNGNITDADVDVTGTSSVYLTGEVSGNVTVSVNGITTVFIQGTPSTVITGFVDGLGKVLYTSGTCLATSSFVSLFSINPFGSPCNLVQSANVPSFTVYWSCGLLSRGLTECGNPALNNTSEAPPVATPTPTPAPTSAATPTPTPSAAAGTTPSVNGAQGPPNTPNTNTISGPGGTVTTRTFTSGPGASATAGGFTSTPSGNTGQIQQSIAGRQPVVFNIGGGAPGYTNTQTQQTPSTTTATTGPGTATASTSNSNSAFASSTSNGDGSGGEVDVYFNLPGGGSALATSSLDCSNKPRLVPML